MLLPAILLALQGCLAKATGGKSFYNMRQLHPETANQGPFYLMNALLLYPPPGPLFLPRWDFSPYAGSVSTTDTESPQREDAETKLELESESKSEKKIDRQTVVDVFTDDWDDMETCPYWCVDEEDGSFHCCPPEENEHAGDCPSKKQVCVSYSDKEYHYNVTRCVDDTICIAEEKCCFDRCVDARVCKTAITKD